jgi:hypothetical protein
MEDIVALEVKLRNGARRYFMTWGRLFDPVDPGPLIDCARTHMSESSLGGEIVTVRVCDSLQEASREPYFFEALFAFGQKTIPRGEDYQGWRAQMRERVESGHELYFLGQGSASLGGHS